MSYKDEVIEVLEEIIRDVDEEVIEALEDIIRDVNEEVRDLIDLIEANTIVTSDGNIIDANIVLEGLAKVQGWMK